jgi:hypothetical protein
MGTCASIIQISQHYPLLNWARRRTKNKSLDVSLVSLT